jgi:uncharacterized beta-barrel protein YwiB (DUF1934 family)
MLKKVMIHISSYHTEASDELFSYMFGENDPAENNANKHFPLEEDNDTDVEIDENVPIEMSTEGVLFVSAGGKVTLSYDETEISGMAGAKTSVVFDKSNDGLVTMMRQGSVNTALVFEQSSRHICVYETPYMPFELCVHTLKVDNCLLTEGRLYLDYIIEFRGAQAEHNLFTLTLTENDDHPKSISI